MIREINIEEISDGKLYGPNDLVKADCGDCKGCFACCQGMGSSIILDPLDIYNLSKGLSVNFEQLLAGRIELGMVDGVILPNLNMKTKDEKCTFLNEEGRCSIHSFRPGICRIFPLGRIYEEDGFKYFLQVNECKKENRSKIKVKKWIDTPNYLENEKFVNKWHYFLKDVGQRIVHRSESEMKQVDMYILSKFFVEGYDCEEDFYPQFEERMKQAVAFIDTVLN